MLNNSNTIRRALLVAFSSLLSTASTVACDDSPGLAIVDPDVEFRGDPTPPEALYVTKWNGNVIHIDAFAKIAKLCKPVGDPPLYVTLSWYQPDSTKPERVAGLGFSTTMSFALWDCFRDRFEEQGAVPL